ncbi:DUF2512 family protein [Ammoniphilus sp. YIM 78166]|uniref:DUF2512 family protein n=1 Tax=Ammoniphilus sp. YIM 78166 TaxID=1644106 RepID=UPI00106FF0AA|nr:DUF2512 family protein [Ammoniphilus sp. YIM 78166]
MTGLWMKIVVCPTVILFVNWITMDVYYPRFYQALVVGLVLAFSGHMMEVMWLQRGRLWMMTIVDFFASAAIVFVSQFFFAGAYVSMIGALIAASFLAITEYYQHRWLIREGKTEKAT